MRSRSCGSARRWPHGCAARRQRGAHPGAHAGGAPALAEAYEHLSPQSRELRFLGGKARLSPRELKYLTDVDGHSHEALGAVDRATGAGVGVARFVRLAPDAPVAEVAVTVLDAWQRRGLATLLLEELNGRARAEGITHYTALVSGDNEAVVALLHGIGARVLDADEASGTIEYELELSPSGLGHTLRAALRAAASGQMVLPRRIARGLSALLAHHTDAPKAPTGPADGPERSASSS